MSSTGAACRKRAGEPLAKATEAASSLCSGRCEKGDHRLKWPSGHCAPCNPAGFAYNGRYDTPGFVPSPGAHQPAFSRSASRTTSSLKRADTLNCKQAYGGLISNGRN